MKFDIKHLARMEKVQSGKADYKVWLSDVITIVGSLDARVGNAIRVLVDEDKLRRGKSKGILDVSVDPGTGMMDEKIFKVDFIKEGMEGIEKVVVESGGALFSLLMQLTDGEAKNMLMAHARKELRN